MLIAIKTEAHQTTEIFDSRSMVGIRDIVESDLVRWAIVVIAEHTDDGVVTVGVHIIRQPDAHDAILGATFAGQVAIYF